MRRCLHLSLLSLGIGFFGAPFPPIVAAPEAAVRAPADSDHAKALALLDKAAAAYAALEGLSLRTSYYADDGEEITRGTSSLAYDKSGCSRVKLSVSSEPMIVAEAAKDAEAARKSISLAAQWGAPIAGLPLSSLVQGLNPVREGTVLSHDQKYVWSKKARLLPDNGVALTVSRPESPEEPPTEVSLYFAPTDHLLRRVEFKGVIDDEPAFLWSNISDVKINPQFPPDTFIEPVRIKWDPDIKVGGEPYVLKGFDLTKVRGKVVLIDFWATWCGPCVKEVPELLASYQKHHSQGFEIIGISRDTDKKALAAFVKAQKLPWPQVFDRDFGKQSNGARYRVQAIPFTLLIGKDGKIAAVNPRGKKLEPAIQAALAR
jgi:thiol-disulfide isomerase/thioredoxin